MRQLRPGEESCTEEIGVELDDDGRSTSFCFFSRIPLPAMGKAGSEQHQVSGRECRHMGAYVAVALACGDQGEFVLRVKMIGCTESLVPKCPDQERQPAVRLHHLQ